MCSTLLDFASGDPERQQSGQCSCVRCGPTGTALHSMHVFFTDGWFCLRPPSGDLLCPPPAVGYHIYVDVVSLLSLILLYLNYLPCTHI